MKLTKLTTSIAASLAMIASAFTPVAAQAQPLPLCTINIPYSNISFTGTGGGDVICLRGNNITIDTLAGDDTVIDYGDNNHVILGDGFDRYEGGYGSGGDVDGGAGDDYLVGSVQPDDFDGGAGDDTLIGAAGDDSLNGGLGADDLSGNAGADAISGEVGSDILDGGDGTDSIDGGEGGDTLVGGAGDDTLNGGLGADQLSGEIGADTLSGEAGTDTLSGGEGDDILAGGQDIDTLLGGVGLNVCDYDTGEALTATCKYDDEVPLAVDASVTPNQVDSTSSSNDLIFQFTATDQIGLKEGSLLCQTVGSNALIYTPVELYFGPGKVRNSSKSTKLKSSSYAGTNRNMTFKFVMELRAGMYPGDYTCALALTDLMNHSKTYKAISLKITRGMGSFDDLPPTVTVLSITPDPVDSAESEKELTLSWHADDPNDSVGQLQCVLNFKGTYFEAVNLAWWDSGSVMDYRGGPGAKAVNRTSTHTEFTATVKIPKDFQPGVYKCGGRQTDLVGNTTYAQDLASFEIVNSSGVFDEIAPIVTSDEENNQVLDVGVTSRSAKLGWVVTDDTAYSWGYVACVSTSDSGAKILDGVTNMTSFHDYGARSVTKTISGTARSARYDVAFEVPLGTKPGNYVCKASLTDSLGHWGTTQIGTVKVFRTPAGQPSSPKDLAFSPSKPTVGTLSWTQPDSLGDPALVAYVAEYSLDGAEWLTMPKSGTSANSLEVSGLKADSEYWFRVRGENGGTIGQDTAFMNLNWSMVKIRTPKPTVSDTPNDMVISEVTYSGYKLAWTNPSYNGGTPITNFTVEVSADSGKTWKSVKQSTSTSTSLAVSGASPGTTYLVRVGAVNAVGSSAYLTGSVTTSVTKPSAPRSLTSSKVTSTSMTLSWLLPSTNGGAAITDYKVELSSDSGKSWTEIKDGVSNNLAINVSGLRKNRIYLFRVSATNSAGLGDASGAHSVTTLATVPSAPSNLTITDMQSTSAVISWVAPADLGGLNLTDYKVETSRDGQTWSVVPKPSSTSRTLKLSGLSPGSQYQLRISAVNLVGSGAQLTGSLTTLVTTPSVPRNLLVSAISTNAATLSWQLPSSNGGAAISDYTIEISSNCTIYSRLSDGVSNSLSVKLSSLKPGATYCVRIFALNSAGSSESTPVLQFKTLDNKPSAPTALAVKTASTSLVLSWSPAAVGAGSGVIDYVVEVSSNNGATWSSVKKAKSSKTSLTVSGLKSKRSYLFRVLAVNLAGTSPASKTLKVTTK